MPHIGSRKHAKFIRDHYAIYGEDRLPDDWKYVGGGSFRSVFLHIPTNVCYKVGNSSYEYGSYENPREVKNARRLLRKCLSNDQWFSAFVRIPKVSGFTFADEVVVAMEFIAGTIGYRSNASKPALESLFSIGFGDMHGMNYIVDEAGTIWPVDLASPLPRQPDYEGPDYRALNGGM